MQREIERAGIPTVGISMMRRITESVGVPRTYFVKVPFGHALGERGRVDQHLRILRETLGLLEQAKGPGTIVDSTYRWRRSWPA